MEAVHILRRIDGGNDLLRVDLLGERQLDQNTAHVLVGIERGDAIEQLCFAGRCRELAIEGAHARFRDGLGFVADIDFARRIISDQHDRDAGHDAPVAAQTVHGIRNLAAQVGCDCLAVDDTRAHVRQPVQPDKP